MRLRIVIALILTTLIIGGCGVSKGDNSNQSSGNNNQNEVKAKPNVEAFNNQFTEEFLTSTEPVREGYYLLKAKSGAFTLDFPEDMIIDETRYNIGPEDRSEVIPFYHPEDKDLVADVIVEYYSFVVSEESSKDSLSNRFGEELEFETLETSVKGQYTEFAETDDGVLGLIWNDNSQQIQFYSLWNCIDGLNEEQCSELKDSEKEKLKSIIKSIKLSESKSG
ncbi:hypothetical protein SAMN04489762_2995 [Terribacillus saccharophilus]|uniref:Lipoprotein n=1 Tax=Terribacillus saccharophilus TaxID=361277 RepID=A0AAX2EIL5_9BACI|nr:hypothetical protein SAMN04489762_2995 [Terribacillus saccharophilus]